MNIQHLPSNPAVNNNPLTSPTALKYHLNMAYPNIPFEHGMPYLGMGFSYPNGSNLNYSPTQTSLALNPQNTNLGILPDSVQSYTAAAVANFPYEFSVPNVKPALVEETVGSLSGVGNNGLNSLTLPNTNNLSCVAEQSYLQLPSSLKTEPQNSTINLATSELNKQLKQEFTNQFSGNSPSSNVLYDEHCFI